MRQGTWSLGLACLVVVLNAERSAADGDAAYSVSWYTVDTGGIVSIEGTGEYQLSGTAGQYDAVLLPGEAYELAGGFWANRCTCDQTPPMILHEAGMPGETRPHSGYIDPRSESTGGVSLDLGLDGVDLVFSEPVRPQNGADWGEQAIVITATGGDPPEVVTIDVADNPLIEVAFAESPRPPLNEWTTVTAIVEDLCGNRIVNQGNLGPAEVEPDRIDFLFLPADIDQSGAVGPLDLFRYRQIVNGLFEPTLGTAGDYADISRDGVVTPIDLLLLRQLIIGQPPSTRSWVGQTANNPQP